jgi:hypothetical protein
MQSKEEAADLEIAAAYLRRERDRHEARKKHPYDGVLGELPEWFPDLDKEEFLRIRDNLIDDLYPSRDEMREIDQQQVTRKVAATIKEWIEDFINPSDKSPIWPDDRAETVGKLAQLYAVFQKGQDRGRKLILGKSQALTMQEGERSRKFKKEGGKNRAGKYGIVRRVIERLKPSNLDDLLQMFEADDALDELARPSLGPTVDFAVVRVDEDRGIVEYLTKGRVKEVPFKTLQNHIGRLNSKRK